MPEIDIEQAMTQNVKEFQTSFMKTLLILPMANWFLNYSVMER